MAEISSTSNNLTIKQPEEKISPFLSFDRKEKDEKSALSIENETNKEKINTNKKNSALSLPKSNDTILSELRRNAMRYTLTARQIASEYGIPYVQAQKIFETLHQNSNGIIKEHNIPENSTVSFLV